jgi:very-short-patch-repair endonuclease
MADLTDTVLEVIAWCAKEVGKFEADAHDVSLWKECQEAGESHTMDSPIEQVLYCALQTVRKLNGLDGASRSVEVRPQVSLLKYRVDFLVNYMDWYNEKIIKEVVVECDSQTFHERTEKERRYEKKRDRDLQIAGYKVFRFTGKEILKNYMKIAAEIIAFVTEIEAGDLLTDSNIEG